MGKVIAKIPDINNRNEIAVVAARADGQRTVELHIFGEARIVFTFIMSRESAAVLTSAIIEAR